MSFSNKVVWVTGASSGIGKALAIELSKQNAKLIISSRNLEALTLVKQVCENANNIKILALDLEDYISLEEKATEAIAAFGRVDVLINNGGISQRSFVKDTNISVDKRLMDVNYLGTVALTKAVLPYFIKRKSGQFVVTTSIVGKIGTPLRSTYAATKHALHGFFDSLRAENHQNNIAVTLVCPGFVNTNVSKNALTGDGTPQELESEEVANEKDTISPVILISDHQPIFELKKTQDVPLIPESLKEAIRAFIIVVAIRCIRGENCAHNTMLVNVSHLKDHQNQLEFFIQEYHKEINQAIISYAGLDIITARSSNRLAELESTFNKIFNVKESYENIPDTDPHHN